MAQRREGRQSFDNPTVLLNYNKFSNGPTDIGFIESVGKNINWTPGSTAVVDNVSVFGQTSEMANGRWIVEYATNLTLTGSVNAVSMDNNGSQVQTATVLGLPVGSKINVCPTNSATAYGGSAIPEDIRIIPSTEIEVANKVEFEIINKTGLDNTTAFTLDFTVVVFNAI